MSLATLSSRQLIVVTGKGGVGKSTIAAVLARLLAKSGKKVLALEIDPRESLHQLLGSEPSGGRIVRIDAGLAIQNLQPRAVIEGLVREKVPIAMVAKRIVASPMFQHFADGAPGLKEMAILGYALRTVEGEYKHKADIVVLDAPATGHGASMLAAPLLLADLVGGGQIGEMAGSLAGFIADSERCGVVLTTLAEEMPVQELSELVALLKERIGRPPELVVANGLYPRYPDGRTLKDSLAPGRPADSQGRSVADRRTDGPLSATTALWRERRAVNDRELLRLRKLWKGPLAEIPLQPLDRGPALLAAIESVLAQELA